MADASDVLVLGSGFAGLWAAIAATDAGAARVTIVDKGAIGRSSQSKMSAGATVYLLPGDDLDAWVSEIAAVHGGLSRRSLVRDCLATSEARLRRLESWGVSYAGGPATCARLPSRGFRHVQMLVRPTWRNRVGGAAVVGALREQVVRRRVGLAPRVLVTDLIRDGTSVRGAVGVDRTTGTVRVFPARAVVLAAADCSFRGNYACTDAVTGDAFRLAYDAGATLTNMEFLCTNTGPVGFGFEGTGIATRAGGRFVDGQGRRFMHLHHPEGDLAEVCHVSQAMAAEYEAGHGPFALDLSAQAAPGSFLRNALTLMGGFMPVAVSKLEAAGVDLFAAPVPWGPQVQTLRGGVRTDLSCRSDVAGLYAAGLSQSVDPGLFNGWSSMRALWSGERAGAAAAGHAARTAEPRVREVAVAHLADGAVAPLRRGSGPSPDALLDRLQDALFPYDVSIRKRAATLQRALGIVDGLAADLPRVRAADPHELAKAHETASMVRTAQLFLTASLTRAESRGDHCRSDRPARDDANWLRWILLRRGDAGAAPEVGFEDVPAAVAGS